jgi:hypothetical protein
LDWFEGDAMTINYVEKGAGLHAAIGKAGLWLREENGSWITSDDAAVQAIIDGYSLADAKTHKAAEIIAFAKTQFDKTIAGISAGEMAGWPILRAEAIAYGVSGNEADCPSIVQEAADRGITVAALVAKVNANAAYFNAARAKISGTSGKHRDAVNALTTFAEVVAYDYSTGWPE